MIVVLADDFSGAAEIAGIAFRFGLTVELRTDASPESTTDVLVVDTDTRSYSHAKAKTEFNLVLSRLKQMNPIWIYKKTDSVMRGPVLEEIIETMNAFNKKLCLLLPANPEKNRIISNGHYFIDGDLLNYTAFAHDPEYPAKTADVLELLGESKQIASCVRKADQQLPNEGIVICEAENTVDVQKWTEKWTEK